MKTFEKEAESAKETGRIEAFSDGVFAIAITLLVLDIHVPEIRPGQTLLGGLAHEWPNLLGFLIGFFTLLICWINHHYMFTMIYRSNSMLLLLNGLKLLVVSITPFVTAMLSKYIETDWGPSAVSIYCLNFAFMGLAMTGLWSYAQYQGFAKAPAKPVLKATTRLYFFAGGISTFIWLVSYFSIVVCLIFSGIMFCIFLFPKRTVEWQLRRSKEITVASQG